MSADKSLVFGGGIPTEPDVERLRKKFGVPKVGEFVSYEALEACIGTERNESRFKTVFNAWRRELYREQNVIMVAVPTRGYSVATPSERVHISSSKYKHGLKRVVRAGDIAAKTETGTLTADELRAKDHIVNASAVLRLAAVTAARDLRLTVGK